MILPIVLRDHLQLDADTHDGISEWEMCKLLSPQMTSPPNALMGMLASAR